MRQIQVSVLPAAGLRAEMDGKPGQTGHGLPAEEENELFERDGFLYLIRGELAFRCEDCPEGRALLAGRGSGADSAGNRLERTVRSLLDGHAERISQETLRALGIRAGMACAVAIRAENGAGKDVCETIRALAPTEEGDLLIPYSPEMTVMIKHGEDPAEIAEFTRALLDTAEEEAGLRLRAGVGDAHPGPGQWADSFMEAREALRLGKDFHLRDAVQLYRDHLLERILAEIPGEKRKAFREQIFNGRTLKALGQDTLETANRFLESDLNLSDTARQMFIHRNTLTYRLDKIRKETGLDLRKFGDAVVFRVLSALPENEETRNGKEP